jgi:Domain of unknown function (DUF6456)
MPRRNASRARRRNADRNRKNLLALAAAEPQHDHAAAISSWRSALPRLPRQRLATRPSTARYEPPTTRTPGARDTPGSIAARERFEAALRDAGRGLAPILMRVCITDESPISWAGLNGRAETDGVPVLRLALDVLVE